MSIAVPTNMSVVEGNPQDHGASPQQPYATEPQDTSGDTDCTPADSSIDERYQNGYHFPPSHSLGASLKHAAISFWNYIWTPVGFLVTVYFALVVAWGGMLFLLLCNASPAMCYPTCNDINSPRRVWIEYASQVLTALFCVAAWGLAPWRFRDCYYLLGYRILGKKTMLRRLAGIHRGWLRIPGSDQVPGDIGPDNVGRWESHSRDGIPLPEKDIPDAPLTGVRAPPTRLWKVDFVILSMVANTFLQCVLSGFMWGMNRYNRPSWATGLFVALGMVSAAMGGLMMLFEGKRVKAVEGVPVSREDLEKLARDKELGIAHYNNIKDKKPKEKGGKKGRSRMVFHTKPDA